MCICGLQYCPRWGGTGLQEQGVGHAKRTHINVAQWAARMPGAQRNIHVRRSRHPLQFCISQSPLPSDGACHVRAEPLGVDHQRSHTHLVPVGSERNPLLLLSWRPFVARFSAAGSLGRGPGPGAWAGGLWPGAWTGGLGQAVAAGSWEPGPEAWARVGHE